MSYKLDKPYTEKEKQNFIVEYNHNQGLKIEETETALYALEINEIMIDNEPAVDPSWEEKQAQIERERIQELAMTRSDFFDGTIMAWGIGQDELLILIQNLLETLPIENVKKLIGINNFKNALNFYRKHDLFKMLVNIPIQLTDTIQVIITDEHLDKFFDEVNKGNKNIAWQYLPQPVEIPIEEPTEEPSEEPLIEEE